MSHLVWYIIGMKRNNWTLEMKGGFVAHYFNFTLLDAYNAAISDNYLPIGHRLYGRDNDLLDVYSLPLH